MMKRVTFSLDEELKRRLEQQARADRRSVSNVINLCLEKYLSKVEEQLAMLTRTDRRAE